MKERKINIEFIRVFAIIMTIVIHVSNVYIYSFRNMNVLLYNQTLVSTSENKIDFSKICI